MCMCLGNMRALSLSFLFATAAGSSTWMKQQLTFRTADPCVRLLNRTGMIGCATRSSGSLSELQSLAKSLTANSKLASSPPQTRQDAYET